MEYVKNKICVQNITSHRKSIRECHLTGVLRMH